jgi:hypothetical protein
MAFMDVLTHPGILRRRAAGNLPAGIEQGNSFARTWINTLLIFPFAPIAMKTSKSEIL